MKIRWRLLAAVICAGLGPCAVAGDTFPDQIREREAARPAAPGQALSPQQLQARRDELVAEIRILESERRSLLMKFAPAHPDVRTVERRLQIRTRQLEELGPAAPGTP